MRDAKSERADVMFLKKLCKPCVKDMMVPHFLMITLRLSGFVVSFSHDGIGMKLQHVLSN
jgi:hypothetical protein